MGLHQRHAHGRILRGEEARAHLRAHKRDSHGTNIRLNVPEGFPPEPSQDDLTDGITEEPQTAYSVVYVTLPQTFSGAAVYSTLTEDPYAATTDIAEASASPTRSTSNRSSAEASTRATATGTSVATVTPARSGTTAASTSEPTVAVGSPLRNAHTATASASATAEAYNSGELSPGGKAGLAIGIILAIGLALGLVFFCWRRKKNNKAQEEIMDEKHGSFADVGARRAEAHGAAAAAGFVANKRDSCMTEKVPSSLRSTRTTSTAPRLSLRPVTQFLPNLGENRKSAGNTLNGAGAERSGAAWERTPSRTSQNPFDDAPVLSEKQARADSPHSTNPFDETQRKSNESFGNAAAAGAAGAAVGAAAANGKHSPKASWEGSEAPTPRSAHFGTAAAVPVAAGGAPPPGPPRGPNNVHRVQLDFKPSMDDELELRSGQLVRMLHEYDDGWALCIRMDRSQQGVAPRTCLSKLPVKPRPQGPPQGPPPPQGFRPGTAQGPRHPSNPPQPPNGLNGNMVPRPLTPTQSNQGSRSPSPTEKNGEASTSPAGVPARKPVPGQAM